MLPTIFAFNFPRSKLNEELAQTTPKCPDRGGGGWANEVKGPHNGTKEPHMVVRRALYAGIKEEREKS